ncbi:MAG: trigger factor [Dehalococcoidia bacterium]|nr:trigger factor [Dehalococcoidia bacterium]
MTACCLGGPVCCKGETAVKVTREATSLTEVTLKIEMDSADEEPFLGRSYRRVVGRLRVPGFRPGKAPRAIVERYVGRTGLLQEALEFMVPETLDRVIKDESLKAYSQPQVDMVEMEPVSFRAVVPLEPVVDLGNYRGIHLAKDPVAVTDTQVDEVIEQFRTESAPWEPVTRPVQFGDLLNLDVAGTIAGESVLSDEGVDYIPRQDSLLPVPGFPIHLEGMTEGQEKEFSLAVPPDYARQEYAGKECHFRVKVRSIKEKKLAALDDEFAKGVGEGYASLEALRTQVRERLTTEGESMAARRFEEQSLQEVMKTASVQASAILFQQELDMMREERQRSLRNQRIDMDTYLSIMGKTEEEYTEQLRPQAEERLRRHLVLQKLAQEEGIQVSPEEVQAEVDTLASSSGAQEQAMRRALAASSAQESVRSSVQVRKVLLRLVDMVQQEKQSGDLAAGAPA